MEPDEPWWATKRKVRESFLNSCLKQLKEKGYSYEDGHVISPRGNKLARSCHKGYPSIHHRLFGSGRNGTFRVPIHRFVAYLKFGEDALREGIVVRHMDSNPLNSHPTNLELGTYRDNAMDAYPEERLARARVAAAAQRKLTPDQVRSIRKKRAEGATLKQLCAEYGITKCAMSYVVNRKTYQDVE